MQASRVPSGCGVMAPVGMLRKRSVGGQVTHFCVPAQGLADRLPGLGLGSSRTVTASDFVSLFILFCLQRYSYFNPLRAQPVFSSGWKV